MAAVEAVAAAAIVVEAVVTASRRTRLEVENERRGERARSELSVKAHPGRLAFRDKFITRRRQERRRKIAALAKW